MMVSNLSLASQSHRQTRVLIVDDTPQVRRDLHQFLELTGEIEVIGEAADGQDAVRLAVELCPDVIVLDLEMPGLDGFEATCQIKERGLTARIVILSMYASPEDRARACSAGADEFIVKGADFKTMIAAILGPTDPPDPIHSQKGN